MASQDVFFKNLASFWLISPSFSVTMPASLPQFRVKSAQKQSQILFEEKLSMTSLSNNRLIQLQDSC